MACIDAMICCSGSRIESAMMTPAVRMMPRKITAIDSTLREMLVSVRSKVACAFCSRWRILTDRLSIAPIASAWLASMVLRNSSVRFASCSDSLAKPSRSADRPCLQPLQRHALQVVVGELGHLRDGFFDGLGIPAGVLGGRRRQRQIIGVGGDQHGGERLAGFAQRRPDQGLAVPGGAFDDRIQPGHVLGRSQHLVLIGFRNRGLDRAQLAEAVEEFIGDALEFRDRSRQHRVGRGARGQRAQHRLAQQQDLREQFRARLIDVAMDQVLQAAGFAFQQRQDLVGFPHLPHVVPGRTEHLGAVPDHGGQHHDDGRIQRGDRQDAPADRHRADQPDDAGTALRGEARRPFHGFVVPRHCQGQFTPLCEFVRSAAPPRDRAALLRRFRPSRLRI